MISVSSVVASDERIVAERSPEMFRSMSPGSAPPSPAGIAARTRSTVSTHVRARMLVDDQDHARLAVDEAEIALVLDRIDHLAQIRRAHRRAVAVGHDDVAVIRGLPALVVGRRAGSGDPPRRCVAFRRCWRWRRRASARYPPGRCRMDRAVGSSSTRTAGSESRRYRRCRPPRHGSCAAARPWRPSRRAGPASACRRSAPGSGSGVGGVDTCGRSGWCAGGSAGRPAGPR